MEIVIVAFVIAGAILLGVGQLIRLASLKSLHKTITAAIQANSPLAPELIARLNRRSRIDEGLVGVVLIALALAILCLGVLRHVPNDMPMMLAVALFPALIGAALLGWRRFTQDK